MSNDLAIVNMTISAVDSDVENNFTIPNSNTLGFNSGDGSTAIGVFKDSYGARYTWSIATAGGIKESIGDAPYSICPKNWSLPNGSEIDNIVRTYNSNSSGELLQAPVSFNLGGDFSGGAVVYGDNGFIISSTTKTKGSQVHGIYLHATSAQIGDGTSSWNGGHCWSVRCINKK